MRDLTIREARQLLTAWAADRDAVTRRRNEVIRAALDAGVSKSEAHRLTGISRSTIDSIAVSEPPGSGTAQEGESGNE